jgi:hypothetical protein
MTLSYGTFIVGIVPVPVFSKASQRQHFPTCHDDMTCVFPWHGQWTKNPARSVTTRDSDPLRRARFEWYFVVAIVVPLRRHPGSISLCESNP